MTTMTKPKQIAIFNNGGGLSKTLSLLKTYTFKDAIHSFDSQKIISMPTNVAEALQKITSNNKLLYATLDNDVVMKSYYKLISKYDLKSKADFLDFLVTWGVLSHNTDKESMEAVKVLSEYVKYSLALQEAHLSRIPDLEDEVVIKPKLHEAVIEWNEGYVDLSGQVFTSWESLNDALKKVYDDFKSDPDNVAGTYNKVKIKFVWKGYNGDINLVDRVDVGDVEHDLNPYKRTVGEYLLSKSSAHYESDFGTEKAGFASRSDVSWSDDDNYSVVSADSEQPQSKKPEVSVMQDISSYDPNNKSDSIVDTFIPPYQLEVAKKYSYESISKINKDIENTPNIYAQDGKGKESIVHLHYFYGGSDWYVTEIERSSLDDNGNALPEGQEKYTGIMYGYAILNDDIEMAEFGYMDVNEMKETGKIELDLYWDKKTVNEALTAKQNTNGHRI